MNLLKCCLYKDAEGYDFCEAKDATSFCVRGILIRVYSQHPRYERDENVIRIEEIVNNYLRSKSISYGYNYADVDNLLIDWNNNSKTEFKDVHKVLVDLDL